MRNIIPCSDCGRPARINDWRECVCPRHEALAPQMTLQERRLVARHLRRCEPVTTKLLGDRLAIELR